MLLVHVALTATLAASDARLGPPERRYFGDQLSKVVGAVRAGLRAKGIQCQPSPGPKGGPSPGDDPASWISEEANATEFGNQPKSWQLYLSCEQSGKAAFTLGVALAGSPVYVPSTKVMRQGEGWAIRDIGANTQLLVVGQPVLFDPKAGLPKLPHPEHPPVLAVGQSALIASEEGPGKPGALEVLGALDPAALAGALREAASLPVPKTELAAPAPRPGFAPSQPAAPHEVHYAAANEPEAAPVRVALGKDDRVGQVERVLTEDERGYFETVRARAVAAAQAAFHGACTYQSESDDASTSAELGPWGFAPRRWSFGLSCPGRPRPAYVMVKLDRRWLEPDNKDDATRKELGPDALLLERKTYGDQRLVSLAVGARAARPKEPEVTPGLARLGAVELTTFGEAREAELARELLAKADLAPLRELLQHPPLPPASRPVAREGQAGAAPREAVEAEVYRAALDALGGVRHEREVISASTGQGALGKGFAELARAALPDLQASALQDFDRVAATSEPFPARFTYRVPVVLFTEKESGELFPRERKSGAPDGWKLFRERYPHAGGIVTLSRVGLSHDQTQAVVSVSWQADWLAGAGEVWFLRRTEAGWQVAYKMRLWVS